MNIGKGKGKIYLRLTALWAPWTISTDRFSSSEIRPALRMAVVMTVLPIVGSALASYSAALELPALTSREALWKGATG
jgi:hypothetical protein